jgi:hypothetical protein
MRFLTTRIIIKKVRKIRLIFFLMELYKAEYCILKLYFLETSKAVTNLMITLKLSQCGQSFYGSSFLFHF